MKATIEGGPALRRRLEKLEKKVRNKILKSELRKGAKTIAQDVKRRAPEDTGKLKRSVKVRAGRRRKDKISVVVEISGGHETSFVAAVEYGAADQRAQPFIRPAFEANKGPVENSLIAGIRAGIESAGA